MYWYDRHLIGGDWNMTFSFPLEIVIPIDETIFFRGVGQPTTNQLHSFQNKIEVHNVFWYFSSTTDGLKCLWLYNNHGQNSAGCFAEHFGRHLLGERWCFGVRLIRASNVKIWHRKVNEGFVILCFYVDIMNVWSWNMYGSYIFIRWVHEILYMVPGKFDRDLTSRPKPIDDGECKGNHPLLWPNYSG